MKNWPLNRKLGQFFHLIFWLILFAMLYMFFDNYLKNKHNPNRHISFQPQGQGPVVLERSNQGHYLAPGLINQHPVSFLLDTGATNISIPSHIAQQLRLKAGRTHTVSTAAGPIEVQRVIIDNVSLAGIELHNIKGHINPYMQGDTILLGMSFLRHLTLIQKGNQLILKLE